MGGGHTSINIVKKAKSHKIQLTTKCSQSPAKRAQADPGVERPFPEDCYEEQDRKIYQEHSRYYTCSQSKS